MNKKLSLEDIQVGMMFSLPLYNDEQKEVIAAGVKITEADYNRLIRWGIKELFTDGEVIEETHDVDFMGDEITENSNEKIFITIYNWCIDRYKEFIKLFKEKGNFEISILDKITAKLLELARDYKNPVISYMGLKNPDYHFLYTHTINSTILAIVGAHQLNFDEEELVNLTIASLLHDLGMLKIPDSILNKNGELTDDEYSVIKNHPISAYKQLTKSGLFNKGIVDAVLQHHEQYDGNGYPRKLKAEKINMYARIISISDAFEAQIAFRTYRKTKTGYLAMKSVLAEAKNKFDPKVLRAFLTILSIYPPGTLVQMNNNSIGTVVSVNPDAPLRPIINVVIDEFGERNTEKVEIDLRTETAYFITNVLNRDEYKQKK